MSVQDRRIMHARIEEHVLGRQTTLAPVDADRCCRSGDRSAPADIADKLRSIAGLYRKLVHK